MDYTIFTRIFSAHGLLSAIKNLVTVFLFIFGITGYVTCRADTIPPDEITYRSVIADDGVQHVRIEGGGYFFRPNRVIVRMNVPVELTVSVEKGLIPHTLVILSPEAGIAVDQSLSSDARIIRFTPTAIGKYPFYCRNQFLFFKSHREKGMEGVLEVVE